MERTCLASLMVEYQLDTLETKVRFFREVPNADKSRD